MGPVDVPRVEAQWLQIELLNATLITILIEKEQWLLCDLKYILNKKMVDYFEKESGYI